MASLLHWRRIVPAALIAATATLGGSAVVDPATASALPDKEKADQCTTQADLRLINGEFTGEEHKDAVFSVLSAFWGSA